MDMLTRIARFASARGVGWATATAVVIAVSSACVVALIAFPLLAGVPAAAVLPAVVATAAIVGTPICLTFVRTIARVDEQRRELIKQRNFVSAAQRIGRLGIWQHDLRSSRIALSPTLHELLGDPGETLELTFHNLLEMTHPDDRENLEAGRDEMLRNGIVEQFEIRVKCVDGVERTYWVDGRCRFDASGKAVDAYGICQDITERKRIEAALRESEDHYRHAVELNPQMPWTADPEGGNFQTGSRWLQLAGMTQEECAGSGWMKAVHPGDREDARRSLSRSLATGEPMDVEYRLRMKDGLFRWVRTRAAARRDANGSIVRWYGTVEDVHDRRCADEALRESESFARSVLESSIDCVKVTDLSGRIEFMNEPGRKLMEIDDLDDVRGSLWQEFWPDESREVAENAVETARSGGKARFAAFCPTARGTPKWWDVAVSPVAGSDGQPVRLLAVSRDTTGAKHAQDELERARRSSEQTARQLSRVLESTTDSVIMLDRDWRVTYLNERAKKFLPGGESPIGARFWDLFPGAVGGPFQRYYDDAVANQKMMYLEEYYAPFRAWLEVHAYPFEDGLSLFFRDVTRRREAQDRLTQTMEEAQAASRAKSEFLATMSHEIRTPMNGVLGMAEQLCLTRLDPEQKEIAEEIRNSGFALMGIIDDILDFSRVEAGKLAVENEPCDLREVVKALGSVFKPEADEQGLELEVTVDPGAAAAYLTDGRRVRQILTNLISNALKFTEAGSVSVRLNVADAAEGRQQVTLTVSDTGIGMTPETQRRVFDAFEQADASTTRRFGGTGLGLAISKRIAEALDGDIVVESTLGEGSTFRLSLNLALTSSSAECDASETEGALPDIAGVRVLVAEDNRVNARILERLLGRAGCDVTIVEDGRAAVRTLEQREVDIVLMDISMPEMDGLAATRATRARERRSGTPPTPIIALTAHVGDDKRQECTKNGMQAVLSKPFRRAEIIRAIAEHTGYARQPLGGGAERITAA